VVGLAGAAPKGLDREAVAGLGGVLRLTLGGGTVVENVVERFRVEIAKPRDQAVLTPRQAAQVLAAADQAAEAGAFLPPLGRARKDKDLEALNLLARHFLALHTKDKKTAPLEQAWVATQAGLALGGGERADKEEALKRPGSTAASPIGPSAAWRSWRRSAASSPRAFSISP
jgi:hypothetical protein